MPSIRDHLVDGLTRERFTVELRRSVSPALVYLGFVAVALAVMGFLMSRTHVTFPWQQPREYRLALQDAAGVQPGLQEVRLSGLKVGHISGVRTDNGQAVVTATIPRKYGELYRNARVELRPQTPVNDLYVDIVSRGTRADGPLGDRVLPVSQSTSPIDVPEVLDAFDADVRARLKTLIDGFGEGLRDRGYQLRAAFAELAPFLAAARDLTKELAARGQVTRRLVHNARLLTDELGRRNRQLTGLVDKGSATLTTLADGARPLAQIIETLPPTFVKLQRSFGTLRGALDEVDPALRALRPVADELPPALRSLSSIASAAAPALRRLHPAIARLRSLARPLPSASASLAGAVSALRPQAPRLDRITSKLERCELAVQVFFQATPSVFKLMDGVGIVPRGDSSLDTSFAGGVIKDPNMKFGKSCVDGTTP